MTRSSSFLTGAITMLALASGVHAQCALSFAPSANYLPGTRPQSIATGDFNGDGRPDLVTANYSPSPGHVSILLANPGATFQPAGSYAADLGPHGVQVGDFNGDTKADLAVANDSGSVSIVLGNGNGTFQTPVNYPVLPYLLFVGVADFNADTKQDLVVTGIPDPGQDSVFILLGNGDGTFQPPVGYPTAGSSQFWEVAIGDFNADLKLDLAVTNEDVNGIFILLGIGNGAFQHAVYYPVLGSEAVPIATGDLNADGRLDLAVGSYSNGPGQWVVSILMGNGNGTFQAAVGYPFPGGSYHVDLALGDLNADGRLDLAVSGVHEPSVVVRPGSGDGTFQAPISFPVGPTRPRNLLVADLNTDGRPDLATANVHLGSNFPGSVAVLLNTPGCYPDCDCSSAPGILDLFDFLCFQNRYAVSDPYACDCDTSTGPGVCDIFDFLCFQNAFAAGCP